MKKKKTSIDNIRHTIKFFEQCRKALDHYATTLSEEQREEFNDLADHVHGIFFAMVRTHGPLGMHAIEHAFSRLQLTNVQVSMEVPHKHNVDFVIYIEDN